jgi:hypothetical protein
MLRLHAGGPFTSVAGGDEDSIGEGAGETRPPTTNVATHGVTRANWITRSQTTRQRSGSTPNNTGLFRDRGILRRFAAVHESAIGPSRRFWNVRFSAAFGGKAEVSATFAKRRF